MLGAKTSGRIDPLFLVVDVCDLITCLKFGDDRYRGLASAEGQILPWQQGLVAVEFVWRH